MKLHTAPTSLLEAVSRREMLRVGGVGLAGLSLPTLLQAEAETTDNRLRPATARNCIFVSLMGGPAQQDLWDMKPAAPEGIRGPYQPIDTNVPGLQVSDQIPLWASCADKFAILRSLSHGSTDHSGSIAHMHMGKPRKRAEVAPAADDHPSYGPTLQSLLGTPGRLPATVMLPRPMGGKGGPYKGPWAGFLGSGYEPFSLRQPGSTDAFQEFALKALDLPSGADGERLRMRRQLLAAIDAHPADAAASPEFVRVDKLYDKAYDLLGGAAKSAFDLTQEPDALRDRYGRNEYGQSFLLARRLIEAGVRLVNVVWTYWGADGCHFNIWDNHGNDTNTVCTTGNGFKTFERDCCCPSLNRVFPALIGDLHDRGLLAETLVVLVGEFGRTPRINKNSGRDHWGHAFSAILAGGGIRGGQVYGATDRNAGYVTENPVSPEDFAATIYHAFGLTPETVIYDRTNRPTRITDGRPVLDLF